MNKPSRQSIYKGYANGIVVEVAYVLVVSVVVYLLVLTMSRLIKLT